MHDLFPKYCGVQEHKMDPKFRVSIPSAWRPEEGEQLLLRDLTDSSTPHIQVLSQAAFIKAKEDIEKTDCASGTIRDATKLLFQSIQPVKISSQGKLQIPKDWSLKANLPAESQVVLSGCGDYFEIYHPAAFALMQRELKEKVAVTMEHTGLFPT